MQVWGGRWRGRDGGGSCLNDEKVFYFKFNITNDKLQISFTWHTVIHTREFVVTGWTIGIGLGKQR